MVHAIRVHENGDANVLSWDEVSLSDPGSGEVRLKQTAIGLNYIDIYMRSGLYPMAEFPSTLGMEAAGVVQAVGPDVEGVSVGERMAYCMVPGAYATERNVAADKLVHLPDNIDDETAAAMMLKGLTAHYLLYRSYPVQDGDPVLVMASAGGVGLILCQWAKHLGATLIGCVGSE